ncbi:Cytochrome c assembly protein [unidentified eubacterium SCB49]|nr:Cytochrome c assembly protein [unidentified eubacterium SCB49]
MAVGTFLDASSETSPTPYSRELIYNAWWFEAIMILFLVNFLGNIFRYGLHKRERWSTLLLHLAFILVLVGAGITRYIGYEGVVHIREGETSNIMLSEHVYLSAFVDGDSIVNGQALRKNIAPYKLNLSDRLDNDFEIEDNYNNKPFTIAYKDFIKGAKEGLVESEEGSQYLKIVEAGDGNRHDHYVESGTVQDIHNILFAVNLPTPGAINIAFTEEDGFTIDSPFDGSYMRMADRAQGIVLKDSLQPFELRSLYQMADMAFVIPEPLVTGKQGVIKAGAEEGSVLDGLFLDVSAGGETKTVELLGGKGTNPEPVKVEVGGLEINLAYGSKVYELPFDITLNDFIADKYPGTEKGYSAFKSIVTVTDADGTSTDQEIFMNNVMDKDGYRFFQSGFDPDEKGTILAVNHDQWGTWITYIGYTLLYIGLMAILFDPKSRFGFLEKQLTKIKKKKAAMSSVLFLFMSLGLSAQEAPQESHAEHNELIKIEHVDKFIVANAVDKEHAAKFGKMVIQDDGRMKPVNTFASELLRKVSAENSFEGLDANQVFLSMLEFPRYWSQANIIKLKRGNDSIRVIAGVKEDVEKISLIDLFDTKTGSYKLEPYLQAATSTNNPNQFQKDFIKAHESFALLNQAFSGSILKLFPKPNDDNNKWIAAAELNESGLKGKDSLFVRSYVPAYFTTLAQARATGDYSKADEVLEILHEYQTKNGADVLPTENKLEAEIFYNKVDIFNRLYKFFLLVGAFMFFFIIYGIFTEKKWLQKAINVCKYIMWSFFAMMTLGLALRWYINGHAPWKDAYESIIYVAWATVFFGLAFGRKSDLTIASTAFVASIILWVASKSWLDPSIATLQPVLDSYWLMIHVAVIVASYGPFTLGMILGITSLVLILLTNDRNFKKMDINLKELAVITEMALTVGLVMLTIGNFLGGQWANESWGRYWGWDPKETWALISIMVYAFVIHMRLIPGLRGRWGFSVAAIAAYASIMMTYFGVNFYLTGLHSYGKGDVPVTPTYVYVILVFIFILAVASWFKNKKYYKK